MKIGVLSDTHDHLDNLNRVVEKFRYAGVGMVLHAGDHISPFTIPLYRSLGCPVMSVFGNNDGDRARLAEQFKGMGEIRRRLHELTVEGISILIIHEPDFLDAIVRSRDYGLVVYGHTHRPKISHTGGCLALNPGEACGLITGRATAALVETNPLGAEIIDLAG